MTNTGERKARALGINHVVLEVDDLDAALDFYGVISTSNDVAGATTTLSSTR